MAARLNHFQRTMLHWNDLAPYNAVMVVRIPAALELERLRQVINGTLQANGLTNLVLDQSRGTFDYQGGPVASEIKIIAAGGNRHAAICAEIEAQLNTPFACTGRFNPFRFFVMPETDGFSLGIVYFHTAADAEAIALLARDMVEVYSKPNDPRSAQLFNLYPRCRDGLFSHPAMLLKKLISLPALIRDLRSSARRPCRDADDLSNRFTFFALTPNHLETLQKTAKAWDVTLNDLFLALLLKGFSRLESNRLRRPARRKLSVGCIVNLRKDIGLAGQRVFGPFLGTFGVTHEVPDGIGLMELAQDIRRQTFAIKRGRLYLGSIVELAFGRFICTRSSPERQKTFYPKNFPLWGGVTNVNLNPIWPQSPGEQGIDCISTASTGPVIPLVFAVVTIRDIVNVAITWRPAFYSETDIEQLKQGIMEMLMGSMKSSH